MRRTGRNILLVVDCTVSTQAYDASAFDRWGEVLATQHGQSTFLGSGRGWRVSLLWARLVALGSSGQLWTALGGSGRLDTPGGVARATGRPATALGARASHLLRLPMPLPLPMPMPKIVHPPGGTRGAARVNLLRCSAVHATHAQAVCGDAAEARVMSDRVTERE